MPEESTTYLLARTYDRCECAGLCTMREGTYDGLLALALVATVTRGYVCDTVGTVTIEDDARDARVGAEVEVGLDVHDAVDVCGGGIAATAGDTVDVLGPDFRSVGGVEIWKVSAEAHRRQDNPTLDVVAEWDADGV